jgi:mono/diheme cytochrome c family protein
VEEQQVKISHANAAFLMALLVAGTAVAQGVAKPVAPSQPSKSQPAAVKSDGDFALVQEHCSACHSADQVTAANKTADEWAETMDRMVDHGLQISPDDSQRIIAYLAAHYGPKADPSKP